MKRADLVVIGGGVIGLAIAADLARDMEHVVLFDRDYTGREATGAAGGMLAPLMELEFEEFELLRLGRQSLEIFPDYVNEIEQILATDMRLVEGGTYFVAFYDRQREELERLYNYQTNIGLEVHKLSPSELRRQQPLISDKVVCGLYIEDEKYVDNRKLAAALQMLCRERGVELYRNDPVVNLEYGSTGEITAVQTVQRRIRSRHLVIAAGAWSGLLPGLKPADKLPVRPVKGQAVAVGLSSDFSPRAVIQTPDVYCVPHYPDRMILGATMEEKGFERRVRFGGVYDMLFAASEVLPGLRDQPFLETWVGHRPATYDSKPFIGPSFQTPNLMFATGHYRNGILMTPITVRFIRQMLLEGKTPDGAGPFLPGRLNS